MGVAIEIDEDVFEYLKSQAEPFSDTPNSVLRRLLALEQGKMALSTSGGLGEAAPKNRQSRTVKQTPKKRVPRRPTKPKPERGRAPVGSTLPEEDYEEPLLLSLVDAGGAAPSKHVVEMVGKRLDDRLTELDRERLSSGAIRWQNRIQFVRLKMIERGLMTKDSPRGIWAISDEGRRWVEARL